MKPYKSHKIVHAAVIQSVEESSTENKVVFHVNDGSSDLNERYEHPKAMLARGAPSPGDYLVQYDNGDTGYWSWSPKAVFEAGYTPVEPAEAPPPPETYCIGPNLNRSLTLQAYKDTEARVLEVIKEQGFELPPAILEHSLDELDFDSLDKVELHMAVEEEFNIDIPDNEWDYVSTVQSIVVLVATKLDQIAA